MTIGQADTINKLYKSYNDTIIAYKDSLKSKTIKDDSILKGNIPDQLTRFERFLAGKIKTYWS